jgi:capsular polysaccharide export protein
MTQNLWIPPELRQGFPHLPAFFPDFTVLPEGAPCPDGAMIAGEGAAAFHEGPWSAPRFHDVKLAVGLVVPGLPAPPHTPDARLDTAQRAALPFSRFADPFRAKPTNLTDALDILSMWRVIEAENRGIGAFLHMQAWKRDAIARMFGHDNGHAPFAETPAAALAQKDGAVLAWAARLKAKTERQATVPIWRVEDGFIRSIGLGVNFAPAASLAIDPIGMHYDATRPSRLEGILAETVFSPELLTRAAALRATILRHNITKYNVAGAVTPLPPSPGRQRILVVGQVEDDASILFGAGRVRSNLGLLRAVREAAPDAFIIWKPHPDVQTGYRRGYLPARKAAQFADLVLQQGDIRPIFVQVDALHTMTSLAGFEAVKRGLAVTCWGRPFYAGWGLTTDMESFERRQRRLTLDELVAGSLILYPRYQDPVTGLPCAPEVLLERLAHPGAWAAIPPRSPAYLAWWKMQGLALRGLRHIGLVPR